MRRLLDESCLIAALAAFGATIAYGSAWAQIGSSDQPPQVGTRNYGGGPVIKPQQNVPVPEKQPPALPGATSAGVAPSKHPGSDLPPTESLFDAINRGDLAAARDAIARGAELHTPNVLGLTPLELSVDLGRNDITFLLLSFNNIDRGRPAQAGAAQPTLAGAASPNTKKHAVRVAKPLATPRAPEDVTWEPDGSTLAPATRRPPTPASGRSATASPRQFSGDGGTPVPDQGFLGFGGSGRGTP